MAQWCMTATDSRRQVDVHRQSPLASDMPATLLPATRVALVLMVEPCCARHRQREFRSINNTSAEHPRYRALRARRPIIMGASAPPAVSERCRRSLCAQGRDRSEGARPWRSHFLVAMRRRNIRRDDRQHHITQVLGHRHAVRTNGAELLSSTRDGARRFDPCASLSRGRARE